MIDGWIGLDLLGLDWLGLACSFESVDYKFDEFQMSSIQHTRAYSTVLPYWNTID